METQSEYDAVVLGAGEAGTVVASLAEEAGRRVALVYREPWAAPASTWAAFRSKFLIHRAAVAHGVRTAGSFGIRASKPAVDLASIVQESRR